MRCCLRCWHSNTNYTWNTTPTHKTRYYPTRGGILADICSAFAFFHSHTCLSALPADTTDPLSSTVFHWGSAAVCLVLSLYLSAPPIARDVLLYIHFPMQRVRSKTVRFTPRSLAVDPSRESLTSTKPRHHHSLSGVTLQSWKRLSAGNSARSSLVRYVNS